MTDGARGFLDPARRQGHFDRAVVHFNAGRYWHAHEDWEEIWHEAQGARRLWLQGLIQYAAALFHFRRGFHASGFSRLLQTATEKVAGYEGPTDGIRWDRLQADLEPWVAYGQAVAAGAPFPRAPGPLPLIRYEPGHVPRPLPVHLREDRDGGGPDPEQD